MVSLFSFAVISSHFFPYTITTWNLGILTRFSIQLRSKIAICITLLSNLWPVYRMPAPGSIGTSKRIDIRKVVHTNTSMITPIIDTAIAHKDPGFPIIGAG